MNKEDKNNDLSIRDENIDLQEIFNILNEGKRLIIFTTLFITLLVTSISFFFPNKYTSHAVLSSVDQSSSMAGLAGQFAALSSFAGINLSSGSLDRSEEGIEILKSFVFFKNLVVNNDLLLELFASSYWDKENNNLIFDKDIYDIKNKKWVYDEEFSIDGVPSLQEVYEWFKDVFSVRRSNDSGFIVLELEHVSPFVAAEVLNIIIEELNKLTREKDIKSAEQSIIFLEKEISKTSLLEVKTGLNQLKQEQIEKIMIANSSQEYIFKVLSPPYPTEEKSGPNRILIAFFTFLITSIFCIFYLLFENYFFKKDKDFL
tara:strand:+ start:764 stop:1711 length:948 start_codon:yes stop_codon:yes gene_type:complete